MNKNNEQKELIQQAKTERKIAKYSSEYDMTVVVKAVFATFGGLMVILGILEAIAILVLKKEPGVYLANGLVLALFAYVAGWASAIITFFFTRRNQQQQQQSENGGTRQ